MKVGKIMNEYIIKIVGMGYKDNYQAKIDIYDINNNLIESKKTYNGICNVCLNKNKIYKVYISSFIGNMVRYFFTNQKEFIFFYCFEKRIIFTLTDQFYNNLPIMKGELFLYE